MPMYFYVSFFSYIAQPFGLRGVSTEYYKGFVISLQAACNLSTKPL